MGFLLLWIESLAVSLLFMAWITACLSRWRRRWLGRVIWVLLALMLLMPYSLAAFCTGVMKFSHYPDYPWFYYTFSLATAFLAGVIVLRIVGMKRTDSVDSSTAAAQWPRAKLFVVWCAVVALHVATAKNLDDVVCRQIDAIREENKTILCDAAPKPVPEEENAVPLYEQAADAFQCWTGNQQRWMEEQFASFDSKNPELIQFMQEREPAARLLHAAAKRPVFVLTPDPQDPGFILFYPATNVLSEMASFLTLHCRYQLAQGNRKAAWQDVETLFRFTTHVREGKWVNNRTSGSAIEKQAIQALQYVLADAPLTAEELGAVKLDEFLSWRCQLRDLFPVIKSFDLQLITLTGLKNADELRNYGLRLPAVIVDTSLYRIFFFPIDLAVCRHAAKDVESRLSWPYHDMMTMFPKIDADAWRNPGNRGAIATDSSHLALSYLLLPKACAKADARHATAVVALALARFQAKYGRLSDDLNALVPEFLTVVPRDPFDGKPIKYNTTESGVVIHSVGPHTADDAEIPEWFREKPEPGDMTFKLPRWNP